jgi:hypothetical protein
VVPESVPFHAAEAAVSELHLAPGFSIPAEQVATQTFAILAKRGAGKTGAAAVMAEEMHAAGVPFVVVDPVGSWWGLRSSVDGKKQGLPIPILGGHHGDVPLERGSAELVADLIIDETLSCVLDVSALESEAAKRQFLAAFADRLFRQKGRPGKDAPLHLFLEEADDYAPQRAGRDVAKCLGAFQRIVKQGRARGLGATMITQRSAVLNKDLLTQIETLIVLRTTSPQDRKAIGEWVSVHGQAKELLGSLHELKDGEAWIWSAWLNRVERIRFRRRSTYDSGATPTLAARRAPATLADIDLGALRDRMQATIERAQDEDPKALKKRIAELERQLEKGDAADDEYAALHQSIEQIETALASKRARIKDLEEYVAKLTDRMAEGRDLIVGARGLIVHADELLRNGVGPPLPPPESGDIRTSHATARRVRKTPEKPGPKRETSAVRGYGSPGEVQVDLGSTPRRMLEAMRALSDLGVDEPERSTVAGWVGISTKSGTFRNYLSELRGAGVIEDVRAGGAIRLTRRGLDAAEPMSIPDIRTLHEIWYGKLGSTPAAMLRQLVGAYPRTLSREALAAAVGVSHTSGSFRNYLSELRRPGLIRDVHKGGDVAATELLFPEGLR